MTRDKWMSATNEALRFRHGTPLYNLSHLDLDTIYVLQAVPFSGTPLHPMTFIDKIITAHDDVIKCKHFPRYWPFVRRIHRSPVNSPHKGQQRGSLMFYLICAWINGWVNHREAGDFRRHRAHYDVIVMHRPVIFTCQMRRLLLHCYPGQGNN